MLVATRNAGKAAELRLPLEALGYRVVDLAGVGVAPSAAEDLIEVHDSFEENAVAKAQYYADASGGLPTIADDSGLVVEALGGEPGVRSRRWSGVDGPEAVVAAANNAKLLERLSPAGTPRDARFVCAVAWIADAERIVARGECKGRIAPAPRGQHGFGYDPLFEAADLDWRTFAEAPAAEKRAVSHRGRAVAALVHRLAMRAAEPGTG